jgi:protein-tyrosine kinase
MSLIERALGKVKGISAQVQTAATATRRPALQMPSPRKADVAQLRISEEHRRALGLIVPAPLQRQRNAEFRHIKRRVIEQIRSGEVGRVIMVASALAGEGKSYTSANLAYSMAKEPDFSILLVDGDVIKPFLSKAMGIGGRMGLMDAVADPSTDVESLVLTTDIEGLSVLPAGSTSEVATEYFASERMREVLEQLQAVPNRIVVIDSLPLLMTTEARALAPLAGQILLVVRAETTPQGAVIEAVRLLGENANVKVILNGIVRTALSNYVGLGYGYGYGYTYEYDTGTQPADQSPQGNQQS